MGAHIRKACLPHLISVDCAGPFGAVSPLERPPWLRAEPWMIARGGAPSLVSWSVGRRTMAAKPSQRPYLRAAKQIEPVSEMPMLRSVDFAMKAGELVVLNMHPCWDGSTRRPWGGSPVGAGIEGAAAAGRTERLQLADGVGGAAQQHHVGSCRHRQLRLAQC